jgi:hypothetical protein
MSRRVTISVCRLVFVGRVHSPWRFNSKSDCEPRPVQELACMLGIASHCPSAKFSAPKIAQVFIQWVGSMTHILTIQWSASGEYNLYMSWVGQYGLWEFLNQDSGPRDRTQKPPYSQKMDLCTMATFFDSLKPQLQVMQSHGQVTRKSSKCSFGPN